MPHSSYDDYVKVTTPMNSENLATPESEVADNPSSHLDQIEGGFHEIMEKNPKSGGMFQDLSHTELLAQIYEYERTLATLTQKLEELDAALSEDNYEGHSASHATPSPSFHQVTPNINPGVSGTPPFRHLGRLNSPHSAGNISPRYMMQPDPRIRILTPPVHMPYDMIMPNEQIYVQQQLKNIAEYAAPPIYENAAFVDQLPYERPMQYQGYSEAQLNDPIHQKKENKLSKQNDKGFCKKVERISTSKELNGLGQFRIVKDNDPFLNYIKKNVKNSGVPEKIGKVSIHEIFSIKNKVGNASGLVLLWIKTTRDTVAKLTNDEQGGYFLFHDRVAAAFSEEPSNLLSSLRQMILLCAVDLGRMHKSTDPYDGYWDQGVPIPQGYDSVKVNGRLTTNQKCYEALGPFIIPCGETVRNRKYTGSFVKYNEYIVNDWSRIYPLYAVDLEIIPVDGRK